MTVENDVPIYDDFLDDNINLDEIKHAGFFLWTAVKASCGFDELRWNIKIIPLIKPHLFYKEFLILCLNAANIP